MGRQLHRVNSGVPFEDYHPGCLWSILHILHHHHRNNTKKITPPKKRNGRRQAKCCGNPKTISMDRDAFGARSFLDAEANNFLVEQHPTTVSPLDKNIKALVTEDMSKEEDHSHWVLGFSAEPKFQQTSSIHHLEPSDYRLGKISTDWANPIIILHENANTSASELQFSTLKKTDRRPVSTIKECDASDSVNVEGNFGHYQQFGKYARIQSDKTTEITKNKNQMDAKELDREIFHHQVKEHVDVLGIFKVNKELFLNILQDPDVTASKQLTGLQICNRKAKLTKSGSFPFAGMSRVRYLRPSTVEHKQTETWTFAKGKKLISTTQVPKPDAVRSREDYNEKTRPSLGDEGLDSAIKHETSTSSWGSLQVSNHQSWNRLVIGRLRYIKKRIKHAIKESKKERGKANTDGLQRVPTTCTPSTDGKDMPKILENIRRCQGGSDSVVSKHVTDGSDHDLNNSELRRMRRTASLNESMDRYVRLFDSSFSREANLPQSKSLRLRNEDNISSRDCAPKFFRRISSLSDVESIYSLVNEVVQDSEKAVRTEVDCNTNAGNCTCSETKLSSIAVDTNKSLPQDAVEETEFKNMDKGGSGDKGQDRTDEPAGNMVEQALFTSPLEDQEIDIAMNPTVDLAQPILVSELEIMNTAECPISEGSKSNPRCILVDEADSSIVVQNESGEDSLPSLYSKVNHGNDTHFLHFELDNNKASFNYVRYVLQLSGFTGNESLGKWYSLEQPLDPSMFKEMETDLHHQVHYTEEVSGNCDHQLLFDLINEVLLEMYKTSFTYYPRGFSFNHRICPMPKGHRVVDEVWSRICWYLSFRSELDRSLDDIVSQDLAKGDGWMNHQFETDCVALELEDLIYDELLEEVICS